MKYCLVHIPCSDANEAEKISRALLNNQLVACCGLFPKNPLYWWKGKIEKNDKEIVIEAETKVDKFEEIEKLVKQLHSYETPVIISTPILNINRDAADWIDKEVK